VRALCQGLWSAWNARDAAAFAALFDEDGFVVGFDGSQMHGPAEVQESLSRIFADHQTATYAGKVRAMHVLTPDSALLEAVAGMVPPGGSDINPAVNVIQTLVAVQRDGGWRIAAYQNTPAQFHGRPELVEQLTAELRALL
jgi:uncharacterized protein (TIGR02246 family)